MRFALFGSTAIDVSFCGAPAVSWLTRMSGGRIDVPSSGLDRTKFGVMGVVGPGGGASLDSVVA